MADCFHLVPLPLPVLAMLTIALIAVNAVIRIAGDMIISVRSKRSNISTPCELIPIIEFTMVFNTNKSDLF